MQKLLQQIDRVLGISRRRLLLRGTVVTALSLAAIPPGILLTRKLLGGPQTLQLIDDETKDTIFATL